MSNKFFIIIIVAFANISFVFATKRSITSFDYNGICCNWFYDERNEPYDNIILHSGSALSMRDIMHWFQKWDVAEAVHAVYDEYLVSNPKLEGTVVVKFTIGNDGFIISDSILSSTTKNKKFDEDIRAALRKCKWKSNASGTTTVTFPFTFWKSEKDYYRSMKIKKQKKLSLEPNDETYTMFWKKYIKIIALEPNSIALSSGGSRSKHEITQVLDYWITYDIVFTYERYLKERPGFTGKVIFKFTIVPSGDITNISILSSTTDYPEFDNYIKYKFANWVKWKSIAGGNTTVTLTINFPTYK